MDGYHGAPGQEVPVPQGRCEFCGSKGHRARFSHNYWLTRTVEEKSITVIQTETRLRKTQNCLQTFAFSTPTAG